MLHGDVDCWKAAHRQAAISFFGLHDAEPDVGDVPLGGATGGGGSGVGAGCVAEAAVGVAAFGPALSSSNNRAYPGFGHASHGGAVCLSRELVALGHRARIQDCVGGWTSSKHA